MHVCVVSRQGLIRVGQHAADGMQHLDRPASQLGKRGVCGECYAGGLGVGWSGCAKREQAHGVAPAVSESHPRAAAGLSETRTTQSLAARRRVCVGRLLDWRRDIATPLPRALAWLDACGWPQSSTCIRFRLMLQQQACQHHAGRNRPCSQVTVHDPAVPGARMCVL